MIVNINKITQGDDFLKVFLKNKHHVLVTFINKNYIRLGLNWYLSLERCNAKKDALIVCHDTESYAFFQQKKINSVLFDQEAFITTDIAARLNKTFTLKHICMKIFFGKYLHNIFNVTPIVLDADVVCLKDPLSHIINFSQNATTCIYANKIYSDITVNAKIYTGYGGFPVYYSKVFINSLLNYGINYASKAVDEPMTNPGIHDLLDTIGIDYKDLHSLLFANNDLLDIPILKTKISKLAYAIHYRCSTCNIDGLSPDKMVLQINLKEQSMKQNQHWYV